VGAWGSGGGIYRKGDQQKDVLIALVGEIFVWVVGTQRFLVGSKNILFGGDGQMNDPFARAKESGCRVAAAAGQEENINNHSPRRYANSSVSRYLSKRWKCF